VRVGLVAGRQDLAAHGLLKLLHRCLSQNWLEGLAHVGLRFVVDVGLVLPAAPLRGLSGGLPPSRRSSPARTAPAAPVGGKCSRASRSRAVARSASPRREAASASPTAVYAIQRSRPVFASTTRASSRAASASLTRPRSNARSAARQAALASPQRSPARRNSS